MSNTKTIYALTTIDNPINPFDNLDAWRIKDHDLGYDTEGLLAKHAYTSSALFDSENDEAINDAMLEIIKNDPLNIYIRVSKEVNVDS